MSSSLFFFLFSIRFYLIQFVSFIKFCLFTFNNYHRYKFSVLALTYVAYTCYHLTRKPISVVKAVLHRNCSLVEIPKQISLVRDVSNESTWCDYAPFGEYICMQNAILSVCNGIRTME